jgi:hypothetical protein
MKTETVVSTPKGAGVVKKVGPLFVKVSISGKIHVFLKSLVSEI